MVVVFPGCLQDGADPAFAQSGIWDAAELFHAIGVLKAIKLAQPIDPDRYLRGGFLKRHCVVGEGKLWRRC